MSDQLGQKRASSAKEWSQEPVLIPDQWAYVNFDDVFDNLSLTGLKIPQKEYETSGVYPVVDQGADLIGGYTNDEGKVINLRKPVVVFGDHTKCFKYLPFPFAPGADGVKVLIPKGEVDGKCLFYACKALQLPDRGYSRHFSFLKKCKFPLPPKDEQRDIVAKIETLFSELDKGIESLKIARQQIKTYRQAVLKHAFEGKLTEQWRQQNPDKLETPEQLLDRIQQEREQRYQQRLEDWKLAVKAWEDSGKEGRKSSKPKKLKEISALDSEVISSLPEAPPGWIWGKLGLMTCGVEYGSSAKSSGVGDIPVVRMGNLQNGIIDWSDLVFTSDKEEIERYSLQKGDVLFNRTNSPELVGKTAIYKGEQKALFAGYLIRVNHIPSVVNGRYLNYFLNSLIAKGYGNTVKTDGVNQSNINGEKLQGYPFPFCSLEEQVEIVTALDEKLSTAERTLEEIGEQLDKVEILRQSILKKAFSGELI